VIKKDTDDWLVIQTLGGKELPKIKEALLRKLAQEDSHLKERTKSVRKNKEARS
jgi:hypothetical protein